MRVYQIDVWIKGIPDRDSPFYKDRQIGYEGKVFASYEVAEKYINDQFTCVRWENRVAYAGSLIYRLIETEVIE